MAGLLAEHAQVRRRVGHTHRGAVHRAHQQPAPAHRPGGGRGGRPAEQVEQRLQGPGADPTPRLGQRRRGRGSHRQALQAGHQPLPHLPVAKIGEQAAGQQQIHHHPGGQGTNARLDTTGLG
jgi:hypothetical protein